MVSHLYLAYKKFLFMAFLFTTFTFTFGYPFGSICLVLNVLLCLCYVTREDLSFFFQSFLGKVCIAVILVVLCSILVNYLGLKTPSYGVMVAKKYIERIVIFISSCLLFMALHKYRLKMLQLVFAGVICNGLLLIIASRYHMGMSTRIIPISIVVSIVSVCSLYLANFSEKRLLKIIYLLFFLLGSYYMLVINLERSGQAIWALGIICVAYKVFTQEISTRKIAIAACILLGVFSLAYLNPAKVHQIAHKWGLAINQIHHPEASSPSERIRIENAKLAWKYLKMRPMLGFGAGTPYALTCPHASEYLDKIGYTCEGDFDDEYAMVLIQFGLIGFFVFLLLFVTLWFKSSLLEKDDRFLARFIIFSIFIEGFFNSVIWEHYSGGVSMLLLGVLLSEVFLKEKSMQKKSIHQQGT